MRIEFEQYGKEAEETYSLLEIRTFLEAKMAWPSDGINSFLKDLHGFWAEADALDQFFSDLYEKKTKPIPGEEV